MEYLKYFLKSLFIQVLMTKEDMQRYGYRFLTDNKIDQFINSNPYFCNIIIGLSEDEKDNRENMNFISSLCAMFGDNFIWNNLKPVILFLSILFLMMKRYDALIILFVTYNLITFFIRLLGYNYGRKKAKNIKTIFNENTIKNFVLYVKYLKMALLGVFLIILPILFNILKIQPIYVIIIIFINLVIYKYRIIMIELYIAALIIIASLTIGIII